MSHPSPVLGLTCKVCGHAAPLEAVHACEDCWGPLEVAYDLAAVDLSRAEVAAGEPTLWRWRKLLPFVAPDDGGASAAARGVLPAGQTPLVRADRLAAELGLDPGQVLVKNETANPTHSFKDRVVSVAVAKAIELGFDTLACASTGNLANAVAAAGAAAGLPVVVFVPADLEPAKIVATGVYGATVVAMDGSYDDVNRLCAELAGDPARAGWAFVNVNLRPYYAEGSKTIAFETAEQLGWTLPDRVVCPVASGSLFTRIARGFAELRAVGLVDADAPTPAMCGAQAAGCGPVAAAFAAGETTVRPVRPDTIARSLAIGDPADGDAACALARATGGSIDAVTDAEIVDAMALLARTTGIFTETAGGVTVATLCALARRGAIAPGERVVVYVTGDGLKTLDAVADRVRPVRIGRHADAETLDRALDAATAAAVAA